MEDKIDEKLTRRYNVFLWLCYIGTVNGVLHAFVHEDAPPDNELLECMPECKKIARMGHNWVFPQTEIPCKAKG